MKPVYRTAFPQEFRLSLRLPRPIRFGPNAAAIPVDYTLGRLFDSAPISWPVLEIEIGIEGRTVCSDGLWGQEITQCEHIAKHHDTLSLL